MKNLKCLSLLSAMLVIMCVHMAFAETLTDKIHSLKMLPLHYGSNSIKIGEQEISIVEGKLKTETAWGGNGFAVLIKDGDSWQFVRNEDGVGNNVLNWAVPHTEEDAITSIAFMTEKINPTHLYLLKTHRNYKNSPIDIVPAEFTLYVVQSDSGFDIFYFHPMEKVTSKAKYCNSDSAAYHELGIPLPEGSEEYTCALSK